MPRIVYNVDTKSKRFFLRDVFYGSADATVYNIPAVHDGRQATICRASTSRSKPLRTHTRTENGQHSRDDRPSTDNQPAKPRNPHPPSILRPSQSPTPFLRTEHGLRTDSTRGGKRADTDLRRTSAPQTYTGLPRSAVTRCTSICSNSNPPNPPRSSDGQNTDKRSRNAHAPISGT